MNASCIDDVIASSVNKFGPVTQQHGVDLWLGEGALHASSGVNGITNTFVSSLWYAHTLGQLARTGVGILSRQTLLGGDYELINRTTGAPNPDFYVALLWHDLVGSEVLNVTMESDCLRNGTDPTGECAESLRVHAHRGSANNSQWGSTVVVILTNFSNKSAFSVDLSSSGLQNGEQWQLRGHPHADQIFFNDKPLVYDAHSGEVPVMKPKPVSSLQLPPCSVTFVEFGR